MRLGKVYIDNAPVDNVDGLATVIPMPPFIPEILVRDHGGRHVGSTVKKRKQEELALIAATNEIALVFSKLLDCSIAYVLNQQYKTFIEQQIILLHRTK